MRRKIDLNEGWTFLKKEEDYDTAIKEKGEEVSLPHTWNNIDGQDGGNDYVRAAFWYFHKLTKPSLEEGQRVYLEVLAANSSADVYLNGEKLFHHDGGYSLFHVDLTDHLKDENTLAIQVDNKPNDHVYPQMADFTFYGGLYRGVNLLIVDKVHFDLDNYGNPGIRCDALVKEKNGELTVSSFGPIPTENKVEVYDAEGNKVTEGKMEEKITIPNVHLWNGLDDPYLYTVKAYAYDNGKETDEVDAEVGFRSFHLDPKKGFILNGKEYPLRGVSRHQDYLGLGNALTHTEMEQDIALIKEVGATTVRLAHYQHNDYFYTLCDRAGLVVWSEIPYISKHLEKGEENATSQMKELIIQSYNHPSIVCRGLSNEITMKPSKGKKPVHKRLNDLVHKMDPNRFTVMANFATMPACSSFCRLGDATSMNFYHGWYTPFKWLNGFRLSFFHLLHPHYPLGFSEYGAEGLPNLHSEHPHRGDDTEEYQLLFHANVYRQLDKRKYLWATHVWNMFDFGSDGRQVGGDPGKNQKGLVSFDRKIKKDVFYLYKAYWSKEPFVYITGHRFQDRVGEKQTLYVLTNQKDFTVLQDGKKIYEVKGKDEKMYPIKLTLKGESDITVQSGDLKDSVHLRHVDSPNPSYVLHTKTNNASWEKKKK